MPFMKLILLVHLACTFVMIGLMWFNQLVHYPLIGEVMRYQSGAYEKTRLRLATWVIAPPMLLEFLTAVLLVWKPIAAIGPVAVWTNLSLIILVWLITATHQAPKHEILGVDFVAHTHRNLLIVNWIRTSIWTIRGLFVIYLASQAFS